MKRWRALRALARIELRQLARHRGRSALIALLIAVPVAALVGGGALVATTTRTSAEWKATVLGRATLRIDAGSPSELAAARASLPPDARVEPLSSGHQEVRVRGRRLLARSFGLESDALEPRGLAHGFLRVVAGRAPTARGEVALSPTVTGGLGLAIGDDVELASGTARILGTVVDPEDLDLPVVLTLASSEAPASSRAVGAPSLLVGLDGPSEPVVERLRAAGRRVTTRAELPDSDPFETLVLFVFGSFGFFEAALVIAAAFAVGLRRRQREIGLAGSIGATSAGLRAAVALSSIVLAIVGGTVGVAVGRTAAWLLHPFLDGWNGRLNGPLEAPSWPMAAAFALGIVTATGASAWPARTAARLPIRIALGGRRPPPEGTTRLIAIGSTMVVVGFGSMLAGGGRSGPVAGIALVAGSVTSVLGLGIASPWLLQRGARLAGRLPVAWRLAVRDAGRFRARNGPVVTAVLAGLSISLWLAAFVASIERAIEHDPSLRDDVLVVEGPEAEAVGRELARALDGVARAPLRALHVNGTVARAVVASEDGAAALDGWIACGGAELARALDADEGARDLRAGRLVVLADDVELEGTVAVRTAAGLAGRVPAVARRPTQAVRGPRFVVDPDALARAGWRAGPPPGSTLMPWLVRLPGAIDDDTIERARAIAARATATTIDAACLHASPPRRFSLVAVVLCFTTGLIVILVATALSSVESAADAHTLHTLGAAPWLHRRHLAARAGYLAFLGGVLAVPGGLLPALGLLPLSNLPLEFVWPWREMAVCLFVFPAIAYAVTWTFVVARGARAPVRLARD